MGLTLLGTPRGSGLTMWSYTSRVEHLHLRLHRQLHPRLPEGLLRRPGLVQVHDLVRKESWFKGTEAGGVFSAEAPTHDSLR